jgi:hypothetical protein
MDKLELIKELQRVGLMIPPRKDGSPKHQRQLNQKNSYYFILKPVKTSEGSEGSEGKPSNDHIPPLTSLQSPSGLPSDSLKPLKVEGENTTFSTFISPEGSLKVEGKDEAVDIYGLETLPSEPSEPSEPSDTFIRSEKLKVNEINKDDRVTLKTNKAEGFVISTREHSVQTPTSGLKIVPQCLVEFESGDRKWLDADILVLTQKSPHLKT